MSANTVKTLRTSSFPLFALAVVPIFILTSTSDNFNLPKEMILFPIAVGGLVHSILTKVRNRRNKLAISLIFILQIGMIVASVFSEATPARIAVGYPGRANGLVYYLSLFTLVYVSIISGIPKGYSSKVHFAVQVPLAINIVYGLLQYLGMDPIPWSNPYNPIVGTLGNPNFASSFLAIASIYYLLLSLNSNGGIRVVAFLISGLSFFLVIRTESIQGPILFVFGVSLYLISKIALRSRKLGYIGIISSLSSGAFLLLSFLGLGPLGNLLVQYTLQLRYQYWIIAGKSALENPFFGLGPDSYINGFRANRTIEFVKERSLDLTADSAHNSILNFAANFGVINGIIYFALILVITRKAVKLVMNTSRIEYLPKFMSIAWISLLLQSMISIEQIGLGVFQWIIGALLLSFNNEISKDQHRASLIKDSNQSTQLIKTGMVRELAGTLALISAFLACFVSFAVLREDTYLKEIKLWVSSGSQEIPKLDEKIDNLGFITRQEWQRALFVYNYYVIAQQAEKAESTLENLVKSDSRSQEAREQLARLKNFYQRFNQEVLIREEILDLDPSNPQNKLALALSFEKIGDSVKSTQLAKELVSDFTDTEWAESATVLLNSNP